MTRALFRASGVATAVVLAAAALTVPTAQAQVPNVSARAAQVTLKAAAAKVDEGKRLVLTGTVRNRPAGTTIALQRLFVDVGVWKTIEKLTVGRAGAVRYVDRPHRRGDRRYRLVVPKRADRPRVASKAVPVTVWGWYDLASEFHWKTRRATFQNQTDVRVGGDGDRIESPAILGDSVVDSGFMTWNTRGSCDAAEAKIQGTDRGLGTGHGAFTEDDVVVQEGDLQGSTGTRIVVRQDITGAETIGFEWRKIDDDFEATMYEARMHCPF